MPTPLRVLIAEDRPADAELMVYELIRSGFDPKWKRVETEEEYLAELQTFPDVILSDHGLPQFNAPRALELLKETVLDIPLIVVTGSISEEVAVKRIKEGASDYILKDRMTRLGEAVRRALEDKKLRDEKRQAQAELQARYRELQTLQEISQIILTSSQMDTTLGRILDKTCLVGSFDLGVIRLFEPTTDMLEPKVSRGYKNPENLQGQRKRARDNTTGKFLLREMEDKQPRIEENVSQGDGLRTLKKEGVQSAILIPVRAENEILGVIQLGSRTARKFNPDEVRLLETIGHQMGIAIQKARLNEETQRNLNRIRALHEIDLAITSTLDLSTILRVLLEKIEIFLPITAATTVRLLSPETSELESLACRGLDEKEWRSQARTTLGGRAQMVVESKAPVVVHNIQTDARTYNPAVFRGLVSYLGVPLIAHDEVLGILSLYTRQQHEFSKEEIEFLVTLAGQAAIAIHNARLYEKIAASKKELEVTNRYLQRSLRQLSGLYTALSPLADSESIREMMDGIIERLMAVTGADAALIRIKHEATGALSLAIQRGFPDHYLSHVEAAPSGSAGDFVFRTGEIIIAPDIAAEGRLKGKVQLEVGLRSCALFPLRVHNDVRGIIHLASRQLGYFDEGQKEHLEAIARQMGIALENKELFDNLRRSRDELAKANNVKDEFLSVMSHELRTPLNVVMGYAGMIQDRMLGEINQKQEEASRKIIRRTQDLLGMVNGILYATSLEANEMRVERRPINISELLADLRLNFGGALEKDLALVWDCASDLPVISTDSQKLKHILENLIHNAVKFTEKGTVTISAKIKQGVPQVLEFTVTDTGIGIAKEHMAMIFDKFKQVDSSETRLYGGVGLGLYIVKKFTDLLGGTVEVQSEPEKGSTFTVRIPCERQ